MKSLRNIAAAAVLTFSAFGAMTYTSCNTDKCKSTVCQNGGTCNSTDGSCTCQSGYEGNLCQTLSTTKYLGNWTGHWQNIANSSSNGAYASIITQGTTIYTINISDFSDYFIHTVVATVSGTTVTIPNQSPDGTAFVSGNGTYNSDNTITFTYGITNSGVTKNFTDTFK